MALYVLLLSSVGIYAAIKVLRDLNERLRSPVPAPAVVLGELRATIDKVRWFVAVSVTFEILGLVAAIVLPPFWYELCRRLSLHSINCALRGFIAADCPSSCLRSR